MSYYLEAISPSPNCKNTIASASKLQYKTIKHKTDDTLWHSYVVAVNVAKY